MLPLAFSKVTVDRTVMIALRARHLNARFVVHVNADLLRLIAELNFLHIPGPPNPQQTRVKLSTLQGKSSQHQMVKANGTTLRYHKMLGTPTLFPDEPKFVER